MILKDFNIIFLDRIEKGTIQIQDGIIRQINNSDIHESDEVKDGHFAQYLSPGFIDVHIHGAGGRDTMEGTFDALNTISQTICQYGTTSFLPTTMTQRPDLVRQAVRAIKENSFRVEGAQIIGIHMEGPFINLGAMGAQNPQFVTPPSVEAFQSLVEEDEDFITTVTLAPEVHGALGLIRYFRERGINASIGHTSASYEEAMAGIEAGCNHSTHLFNTMPPFLHRKPGVVGAVFDTEITTETISDGIHVAYPALRTAYKVKGADKVLLVTDAMMACGMHDGDYSLGGQAVVVKDGAARLRSGALAGSILTLDKSIANVIHHTSLPLYDVVRMATYNPAVLCGVEKHKGQIADGYDADLVIFDDDIAVKEVYIKGRRVK